MDEQNKVKRPIYKRWWFWIVVVVVLIFAANGNKDNPPASGDTAAKTQTQGVTKAAPEPLPISDVDFFKVREASKNMTDVQWKEYLNGVVGKRIQWTGYVDEVKEDGKVWIDMDPPDALSVQDIYINVPKEDALKYNKDQKLTFQGTIKSVSKVLTALSIDLKDITIVK